MTYEQVHQYLHRTCDCSLFILRHFQGGVEATTTLIHEKGNMESMLTSERPGVPRALSISANTVSSGHDVTVAAR